MTYIFPILKTVGNVKVHFLGWNVNKLLALVSCVSIELFTYKVKSYYLVTITDVEPPVVSRFQIGLPMCTFILDHPILSLHLKKLQNHDLSFKE